MFFFPCGTFAINFFYNSTVSNNFDAAKISAVTCDKRFTRINYIIYIVYVNKWANFLNEEV